MKKFIAVIACSLTLLCLCGCSESLTPVDYGFEFEFLAEASTLDFTGYEILPGYGCSVYYDSKYVDNKIYVQYTVSGAPDCLDPWRLTCIQCTDPEVKFFGGLTLADDGEIREYLESDGFKIKMKSNGLTAEKGRIFVNYVKDEMLTVMYQSTNIHNVDF